MIGVGWGLIAVGGLLALGGLALELVRRRRGDVFDHIEPPRVAMPMRCICTARLSCCSCAVDGVRNPRGAGRARASRAAVSWGGVLLDEGGGP